MACQRSGIVRAAAARKRALSLAKAISMGLKSERLCHVNLNWPREVSTTEFEFMRMSQPRPESFFSEDAERAARCEMALDVESVLDSGVNGQEALS
jgi:hypothetical protein